LGHLQVKALFALPTIPSPGLRTPLGGHLGLPELLVEELLAELLVELLAVELLAVALLALLAYSQGVGQLLQLPSLTV